MKIKEVKEMGIKKMEEWRRKKNKKSKPWTMYIGYLILDTVLLQIISSN